MTTIDQTPLQTGHGLRTEPDEILDGMDLQGVTAVVTGGYSGIGLETTRALAARGATVVVPARRPEVAGQALADVAGDTRMLGMDLADLASVRSAAATIADDVGTLDLLINNAGVMATPEGRVGPGWERQFGVNHLGHMALTLALLPALRAAVRPRVVALSSAAHLRNGIRWHDLHWQAEPYDKWSAYAQSKTANALFAVALSARLSHAGGLAFSVHPGGILTPLQRDLPLEEQVALGWRDPDGTPSQMAEQHFKTTTQGASTTLWAATAPELAERGGQYCEDGDIAVLRGDDPPAHGGVNPYAVDLQDAERLWQVSEELITSA